jgi:hypothetical protein
MMRSIWPTSRRLFAVMVSHAFINPDHHFYCTTSLYSVDLHPKGSSSTENEHCQQFGRGETLPWTFLEKPEARCSYVSSYHYCHVPLRRRRIGSVKSSQRAPGAVMALTFEKQGVVGRGLPHEQQYIWMP